MRERQQRLMKMLHSGGVLIRDVALELGVTEMTIRRDLRFLAQKHLAILTKGGAVLQPPIDVNKNINNDIVEKQLTIARALYERIMPSSAIYLSTGGTTLAFARVLVRLNNSPITVVTNSLAIANTLFRSCCKVILLGGELRSNSPDLVGPVAEKNIENYHVDWLISGCDAALSDQGYYTSDLNLSHLEEKSLHIAEHVAIITSSYKFGHKSLTRFAKIQDIELLVTDNALSAVDEDNLKASGTEVIRVVNESQKNNLV